MDVTIKDDDDDVFWCGENIYFLISRYEIYLRENSGDFSETLDPRPTIFIKKRKVVQLRTRIEIDPEII